MHQRGRNQNSSKEIAPQTESPTGYSMENEVGSNPVWKDPPRMIMWGLCGWHLCRFPGLFGISCLLTPALGCWGGEFIYQLPWLLLEGSQHSACPEVRNHPIQLEGRGCCTHPSLLRNEAMVFMSLTEK